MLHLNVIYKKKKKKIYIYIYIYIYTYIYIGHLPPLSLLIYIYMCVCVSVYLVLCAIHAKYCKYICTCIKVCMYVIIHSSWQIVDTVQGLRPSPAANRTVRTLRRDHSRQRFQSKTRDHASKYRTYSQFMTDCVPSIHT